MSNCKYRHFYYWENLIRKNEIITEGFFRDIPMNENSIFINTVIVNCETSIFYDWWICYPDINSALGFIQNVFLASAFDVHLMPEQDKVILLTGTVEELLEIAEDSPMGSNKDTIPELREFKVEIDSIWEEDEEKRFDLLKAYSIRFNDRWGNGDNLFFYFHIFKSAEDVGKHIIDGYETEDMLDYFVDETGLTREQWEELYMNVYNNEFIKKRFMDILNNKICDLL